MNYKRLSLIVILAFSIVILISQPWSWSFEDDILSTIAIFTAIGSAIGLVLSHIVTAHQIKQESDAKFLELTHEYTKDLVTKFDQGFAIKDVDNENVSEEKKREVKEECVGWAFKYVDALDMMAYIKKKEAIPSKITEYFGPGWFGMAKSLMIWHDEVVTKDKDFNEYRSAIETWPHVYEHCFEKNNNVKPIPDQEFPPLLRKYFSINFETIQRLSEEKQTNFSDNQKNDFSITHHSSKWNSKHSNLGSE